MFGTIKLKRKIEELEKENRFLKFENDAIKKASDKVTATYQADMKKFQAEIDGLRTNLKAADELNAQFLSENGSLHEQVKKLTRKRDEKGRFMKNNRNRNSRSETR